MYAFDVVGIGNPLLDKIVSVGDGHLLSLGLTKGTMRLLQDADATQLASWLSGNAFKTEISPGGSCCNSMVGLATLGGTAAFIGAIGDDEHGTLFEQGLRSKGVEPVLIRHPGLTGTCHVLVTPDAERTMNTHLGASSKLHKDNISPNVLLRARCLHLEGYLWDTPLQAEAAMHAIEICKMNRMRVSLDVADPFVVERYGDVFREILPSIDILFANEREAELFTGEEPAKAVELLGRQCGFVAVKLGAKGSLISHRGKIFKIPPYPVRAVDTTGAGDMYAGAALFGLSQGYSAEQIGRLASYASAMVVSQQGAQLASSLGDEIEIILSRTKAFSGEPQRGSSRS